MARLSGTLTVACRCDPCSVASFDCEWKAVVDVVVVEFGLEVGDLEDILIKGNVAVGNPVVLSTIKVT